MAQPPFEIFLVPIWLRVLTWSGTAAHNLVRFDHVSQLFNFRVLVATKCCCCCAQFHDAEFNLLAVQWDETTVRVSKQVKGMVY